MPEWVTGPVTIQDVPAGWAAILAALIAVVGGPVVGVVLHRMTKSLRQIRKDAAVTRDHVANEHVDERGDPINMRDDQDQKHAEVMALVTEVATRVEGIDGRLDGVERDIRGMQKDVGRLGDADLEQTRQQNRDRERLDYLEHTIPRDQLGRFMKREEQ